MPFSWLMGLCVFAFLFCYACFFWTIGLKHGMKLVLNGKSGLARVINPDKSVSWKATSYYLPVSEQVEKVTLSTDDYKLFNTGKISVSSITPRPETKD
jgi:hypothetical protein